jgi:hypothetical protein
MKKLFALLMVCGFALAFVACGGGEKAKEAAAKAKADSTAKADSVAKVEAEATAAAAKAKMKADSTAKADSVAKAAKAPEKKKKK